jgi:hypothetical protein
MVLVQNIQGSLNEISSNLFSLRVQVLDSNQLASFDWLFPLVLPLGLTGARGLLVGRLSVCLGSTALALALTFGEEKRPVFTTKHTRFVVQNIGDCTGQAIAHGTRVVVIVHRIGHRTSCLSQEHGKAALVQHSPVERRDVPETTVFRTIGTRGSLGRSSLNITMARRNSGRRSEEGSSIAVFLCIIGIVVAAVQRLVVQLSVFETLSGQSCQSVLVDHEGLLDSLRDSRSDIRLVCGALLMLSVQR